MTTAWWKWHSGVNAGDVTVAINEGCIRLGVGGKREREEDSKVLNWVNKDIMMLFTETETQKELWTCGNCLVSAYQRVLLSHSASLVPYKGPMEMWAWRL